MSVICPVCGCKTEEIDMIDVEIADNKTICVCDYCNKQIGALNMADGQDPDGLARIQPKVRWLDTVLAKQVEERDADCTRFLASMRNRFPRYLSEQQTPVVQQNYLQPDFRQLAGDNIDKNIDEIEKLKKRIETLEAQLFKLRRFLLVSNILEFVIPAILVIIIAIIFFKSDLWVNLSSLIYSATGGTIQY